MWDGWRRGNAREVRTKEVGRGGEGRGGTTHCTHPLTSAEWCKRLIEETGTDEDVQRRRSAQTHTFD